MVVLHDYTPLKLLFWTAPWPRSCNKEPVRVPKRMDDFKQVMYVSIVLLRNIGWTTHVVSEFTCKARLSQKKSRSGWSTERPTGQHTTDDEVHAGWSKERSRGRHTTVQDCCDDGWKLVRLRVSSKGGACQSVRTLRIRLALFIVLIIWNNRGLLWMIYA